MAISKKRKQKNIASAQERAVRQDKLTWKYWLIGAGVIALLIGVILLVSVIAEHASYVRFTESEGVLVRESDRMTYQKAPATYVARYPITTRKGNAYGEADGKLIYKMGFYNSYGVLKELDVDNYLTDEDGSFYYGSYALLPTLENFSTDLIYICADYGEGKLISLESLAEADAQGLVLEYLAGNRYIIDDDVYAETTYTLHVTSSRYDYLYYVMYLVRCSNGDYYIYTSEDRSSIKVSSSYFSKLEPYEEEAAADCAALPV